MTSSRSFPLGAGICLLVACACARGGEDDPAAGGAGRTPGAARTSAETASAEAAADTAGRAAAELPDSLLFTVRGGVAGFDFVLAISGRDGEAVLVSRGEEVGRRELAAGARHELAALVREARPAAAHVEYGRGGGQIADAWWRSVRVVRRNEATQETEGWEIEDLGGPAEPLPAADRRLFDRLMEIAVGMLSAATEHPPSSPR